MVTPLRGWLRSVDPKRSLCILLIVLLAVPLGGQAEPQVPQKTDTEVPPAAQWLEAMVSKEPLPVRLEGQERALLLESNERILRDDLSVPGPLPVHPLKGRIEGSPDSHLRVTIVQDMLLGYIEDPYLGRFVLGPDENGRLRAALAVHGVPETPHPSGTDLVVPADDFGCLHPLPMPLADPIGLLDGWPERWFDLAVAVDEEFVEQNGDAWAGRAVGLVNNADGFYFSQVGLSVGIVDLRENENITGSTAWEMLTSLRSQYRTHHGDLERDNVHLFTGKNVHDALGESYCIGGAGDNDLAYTIGMTSDHDPFTFNGVTLWGDIYTKILVHELGHILSAHHHYANCQETAPFYETGRPLDTCTVMTNSADVLVLKFSMMNKLVTRGWVDTRDL